MRARLFRIEFLNESVYTNVSIGKSGYTEVVPGQEIRYTFRTSPTTPPCRWTASTGATRCRPMPCGWIRSSLAPIRPG